MTSGWHSARTLRRRGKSRMSAQTERSEFATCACSKRFGWVGGASEYPVTLAPRDSNHKHSQLPLNPVCPVTSTLRLFQNDRLSILGPSRRSGTLEFRMCREEGDVHVSDLLLALPLKTQAVPGTHLTSAPPAPSRGLP